MLVSVTWRYILIPVLPFRVNIGSASGCRRLCLGQLAHGLAASTKRKHMQAQTNNQIWVVLVSDTTDTDMDMDTDMDNIGPITAVV
jgi:tRNA 2-selenouridine synthase SelU